MEKDIEIGIVTYNPTIQRLAENIENIYGKSGRIIIFDNCSKNCSEIEKLLVQKYPDIYLVKNKKNKGLGHAYNYFFKDSIENDYDWVMLLDQDSVCIQDLLDIYRRYISTDNQVGMYTCLFKDRNCKDINLKKLKNDYQDVGRCISSASLMRTEAFSKGCVYDEKFFIDKLDYDICYSLQEKGYLIRQLNFCGFLHEIGSSREYNVLGHTITVYNHSPLRRYYMARNGVWLSQKHNQRSYLKSIIKELCDIFWVLVFEKDQKKEKFYAFVEGMRDGLKVRKI